MVILYFVGILGEDAIKKPRKRVKAHPSDAIRE